MGLNADTHGATGMSWLHGVRILDCTRLLPHAYATQMLVALGADVIKIEPPGSGDYGRGMAPTFLASNGHKRSISLNLRSDDGKAVFRRLADTSACVVESFRPGVMKTAGLDFETLASTNPALVYCSASGYGQTGPYADIPGHDLNYLGVSGLSLADGTATPALLPVPIVDMATGPFIALSIVAAIAQARETNVGQAIDLSLFDVALSINMMGLAYSHGRSADPTPNASEQGAARLDGFPWPDILVGRCPCYGVFDTSDGKFVSLGNVEEKFWMTFLKVVGLNFEASDRFAIGEPGRRIRAQIETRIAEETQDYWISAFRGQDVCFAPVLPSQNVIDDEHVKHRGSVFVEKDRSLQIRFPGRFSVTPAREGGASPSVGQDTDELLDEIGYGTDDRERLRADGVV
jgi:crotonobetainyl-CoA:carnitine CoA-transferase CaiB-like acyl-CoA transferase